MASACRAGGCRGAGGLRLRRGRAAKDPGAAECPAGLLAKSRRARENSGSIAGGAGGEDKQATFTGDVHVLQGDTEMRCKLLTVFYEGESGRVTSRRLSPGPGGDKQIKRIEAKGSVVVVQKDQNAAGDAAIFNMRENTVTLIGNVVVTRGADILRGQRLVVDLTTGVSKMDQGRVEGLFQSGPRNTPSRPAQRSREEMKRVWSADCDRRSMHRRIRSVRGVARHDPADCGHRRLAQVLDRAGPKSPSWQRVDKAIRAVPIGCVARRHWTAQLNSGAFEGRGVLNILALFRHRRAPRRTRKPNGSSQSMDLTALGGPISSARGTVAKASPTKPRPRQDAAASRQQGAQGYLAAHNLQKSYGGRRVVNGVSLYVRRGEAVGLLGPNGAGKTTAFYMITGLIKAESGQIELDGHDVTHLPMYQRARLGIGYLPQEASIFRGLNVEDNIRAVLEVVEPDRRRRDDDLNALLEEFEITRHRKTPSIALSGGERRRVEIARALASRPNYMLLDEPFAGIDPKAVVEIQRLVRRLTNRGIGVLITDHNVRETLDLTDRSYIIYSGQVLMEGRKDDIVNDPEVRRLYLGEDFRI